MKIANRDARRHVQSRTAFVGSNLFGATFHDGYAVFSYGTHWPLFIYSNGMWFEKGAWDNVLMFANHTDEQGNKWYLHQDGDLWMFCPALMTDEEYENFFGEKRHD